MYNVYAYKCSDHNNIIFVFTGYFDGHDNFSICIPDRLYIYNIYLHTYIFCLYTRLYNTLLCTYCI